MITLGVPRLPWDGLLLLFGVCLPTVVPLWWQRRGCGGTAGQEGSEGAAENRAVRSQSRMEGSRAESNLSLEWKGKEKCSCAWEGEWAPVWISSPWPIASHCPWPLPLQERVVWVCCHTSGKLGRDTLQGILSQRLGDPPWWQSRAAGAGSLLGSLPPRWGLRSLQSLHCCRLLLLKIFFNVLKKKRLLCYNHSAKGFCACRKY